jgi:hypothetical protein
MAKIIAMPSKDVIDGFRGVVDFYRWCDLVIARKWPHAPDRARSEPVQISGAYFAYINQHATTIDEYTINALNDMASQSKMTWKDWLVSLYLSGSKYINPAPE